MQREKIKARLATIFKVLESIIKLSWGFESILTTDLSEFKKHHKKNDFAVEFYKNLLDQGIKTRARVEELFFEPVLKLGPFHVNCEKIRALVLKKIVDLDSVMVECIKRKISNNNT